MIEVGIWGAFLAGLISFITPCVLPMVPFQLAYLAGSNIDALKGDNPDTRAFRTRAIVNSIAFALGLVTIFVLLGLGASALGSALGQNKTLFQQMAGALLIILGGHFIGIYKIPFLMGEHRLDGPKAVTGVLSAYVVGLAFAFGWTACVGPILASILFMAAQTSLMEGGLLLFAYGMGMALPFVFAAVLFTSFTNFYQKFRRHLHKVEIFAGVMMIIFGILLISNKMNVIANWLIEKFPAFTNML